MEKFNSNEKELKMKFENARSKTKKILGRVKAHNSNYLTNYYINKKNVNFCFFEVCILL